MLDGKVELTFLCDLMLVHCGIGQNELVGLLVTAYMTLPHTQALLTLMCCRRFADLMDSIANAVSFRSPAEMLHLALQQANYIKHIQVHNGP